MIAAARKTPNLNEIPIDRKLIRRFWSKVSFTGKIAYPHLSRCWEWTASVSDFGYGCIGIFNHDCGSAFPVGAHRISYLFANGSVPDGLHIRHRCDNPPCVRPGHLLSGTAADNSRDAIERNRLSSKITKEDVAHLKYMLNMGISINRIAAHFGVSATHVWNVRSGYSWGHVEPLAPDISLCGLMFSRSVVANNDIDDRELLDRVEHALLRMPKRNRLILQWRFGLNGTDSKTLEEIGESLGLTRERVRQLESQGLERLRRTTAISQLMATEGTN